MIDIINFILREVFDTALSLFRNVNPWAGMTAVSILTALSMLLVYRLTSDQIGIRAAKEKIIAHLLEVRLYRNDLSTSFRSQGNILRYNLKYLAHSARPMLVMVIPLLLVIVHLDQWFGLKPLGPGETAILKVRLEEGYQPSREDIVILPSRGFEVETFPLRIDREGEVDWRLHATETGIWDLRVVANGQTADKKIVIGAGSLARISTMRVARNWFDQLASPGEAAIPEPSIVKSIQIGYPARSISLFGWHVHWLVAYLALSILFGFVFKPWFRVEI